MPTYQYECDDCHHSFEILQSMLDKKLKTCPECGKDELHRLIGAGSGIIFKGSGFYETDYKNKNSSSGSSGSSKGVPVEEVKAKSEKKPESNDKASDAKDSKDT